MQTVANKPKTRKLFKNYQEAQDGWLQATNRANLAEIALHLTLNDGPKFRKSKGAYALTVVGPDRASGPIAIVTFRHSGQNDQHTAVYFEDYARHLTYSFSPSAETMDQIALVDAARTWIHQQSE